MEEIRLGVIGAGRHCTRRLLPVVSRLENVCLAAICDLDIEKAKQAASRFGAKAVFNNAEKMFVQGDLNAVAICVGPEAHSMIAIQAMQAGLPVYTEKPPAITAELARKMLSVSQETGQICMTGFKKRYAPSMNQAHSIVKSSDFGDPHLISIWRSSGPFDHIADKPTTWFLLDMGIHTIDLMRFLFGEVSQVSARSKGKDSYVVTLKFANEAIGSLVLCAKQSWSSCSERIDITGSNRHFIQIENGIELRHFNRDKLITLYQPNFSFSSGDSLFETGFVSELVEFIDAIRERRTPLYGIEDSCKTMDLYEAILHSSEFDGKTISL